MKKGKICVFLLLNVLVIGSLCHICHAASKEETLALAQKILSDPMLPGSFQGAKISGQVSHKPSKDEDWESYDLLIHGKSDSLSRISLFPGAPNDYEFLLFLNNGEDLAPRPPVTDWDKMVPQWDAFVNRYWPGLHRISDWKTEIWRHSGSGTFSIQYVLTEQKMELFRVVLDIRLVDGKVGGVGTENNRYLLKGKPIPTPPSDEQIISAVRDVLKEKQYPATTDLTSAKMSIDDVRRWALPVPNMGTQILESGNINAVDAKGDIYIITFDYLESKQAAGILTIKTQQELDDFRQKPLTQVDDKQPSWSPGGKQLYFVTSRRASDQPWWTPVAFQYAIAVNQVGTDNLQYISPLKTKHGDYGLYQSPQVSADGQYLAAGLGSNAANLFILNMQRGILHIPERDPAFLIRQQKELGLSDAFLLMTQSMFRSDGNKYPWISRGIQWLANGDFLYLGWLNGGGKQIFLARKTSIDPGQVWDAWPVYQKRGDDTLLCLSPDEKVLSWAHQEPPPTKAEREKGDNAERPWQFVTADFDTEKAGVSNLNKVDLPDKPASISWDSQGKRWLVVTEKNELLWVQKTDGKLTVTKVLLALTWNNTQLRPTSAAVSPDGNHIALAAELENPVAYSQTECVVRSMIFDWDGKSTFVKPFYDPSINGIPRYIFPASGSTWAEVEGNLKKWGLQDMVDPAFVAASAASPGT
jgi:hypothetical protein